MVPCVTALQRMDRVFFCEPFQSATHCSVYKDISLFSDALKPKLPNLRDNNNTANYFYFLVLKKPFKMIKGISDLSSWVCLDFF